MGGKKKMYARLESLASELYNSEQEVLADQERIISDIFDKNPDFAYLKEDSTLSDQVRSESLKGLRVGIAAFMAENNITDLFSVFDTYQYFSDFYYGESIYNAIEDRLKKDNILRKGLCKTEELSLYECEHIAEVVSREYVGRINNKLCFENVDMPQKPNEFDE